MPQLTFIFAAVLIALGVATWLAAGQTSATALIPAFFGLGLVLAGLIALRAQLRKHAMHLAATIALLGAIGAFMKGIPGFLASGEPGLATLSQLGMGAVMLVYLVLCVRSFIAVRRAEQASD